MSEETGRTQELRGASGQSPGGPGAGTGEPGAVPDILTALADRIGEPDGHAADAARVALGGEAAAPLGRLAELAYWWASVRGDPRAGPPRRVLMVGAGSRVANRRDGASIADLPAGDVDTALAWGRTTGDDAAGRGVELVVVSLDDPGATRALAVDLLGLDAVEASGWPLERGLSDAEWMDEVAALRDRLHLLGDRQDRPSDLLRDLGAPRTAGAVALLVQAAVRRTPALLDGPGAAAAALLARRVSYPATAWWQAAHQAADPVHERALGSLGLEPLTRLDIAVEDGTAGLAGLAILDQAAALLGSAAPVRFLKTDDYR